MKINIKDIKFKIILKQIFKWFFIILISLILFAIILSLILKTIKTPKLNSNWEFGQEIAPQVKIIDKNNGDKDIEIINLRDFDWLKKTKKEQKKYINYKFKLSDIVGVKMGVSHFSTKEAIAHVFIIFKLKNNRNFGLSIESRREVGEKFSLTSGLMYDYELIYILATEDDLLKLRKKRKERIYLYPIKTTPQKVKNIFLGLSKKINSLYEKPEFYHLFTHNCTGLMADEVEKVSDKKFPLLEKVFLPGYADKAVFDLGLIDTNIKDFKEVKKKFLVEFD